MNMYVLVLAMFALSCAAAAPASTWETAALRALPALLHEEQHDEHGQYVLRYVTAEGTVVTERGRLVPNEAGTGHVLVVDGETVFIGPDGRTYTTKYSAGLDGNKVEGAHLPVPVEPLPVPA